jgi:hypothetical protein
MARKKNTNKNNTRNAQLLKGDEHRTWHTHSDCIPEMDVTGQGQLHPLCAPRRARVKLEFTEQIPISSLSDLETLQFSGNGIFDPTLCGIGHQPRGFDQWAALYQRYTVIASSIKVRVDAPGRGSNVELCFAILPVKKTGLIPRDIREVEFISKGKFGRMFPHIGEHGAPYDTLTKYMSTSKLFSVNYAAIKYVPEFSSSTHSSPEDEWVWTVMAQCFNSECDLNLIVQITYHVEFFDRITLAPSVLLVGLKSMRNFHDIRVAERREAMGFASLRHPTTSRPCTFCVCDDCVNARNQCSSYLSCEPTSESSGDDSLTAQNLFSGCSERELTDDQIRQG